MWRSIGDHRFTYIGCRLGLSTFSNPAWENIGFGENGPQTGDIFTPIDQNHLKMTKKGVVLGRTTHCSFFATMRRAANKVLQNIKETGGCGALCDFGASICRSSTQHGDRMLCYIMLCYAIVRW